MSFQATPMAQLEHFWGIVPKCPKSCQWEMAQELLTLHHEDYFDLMEWAFNQTTKSNKAYTEEWCLKVLTQSINYKAGV